MLADLSLSGKVRAGVGSKRKRLRCEVAGSLSGYSPREEPLDGLKVTSVEDAKRLRIVGAQELLISRRLVHSTHTSRRCHTYLADGH